MLPLGGKPILEHLIEWVKSNGITSVILCVSYLHRNIRDYFEDGSRLDMNIEYAISPTPLATAGQLKTAEGLIDDTFVCMYGDSIFDFDLARMVQQHKEKDAFVTVGLSEFKTNLPYGVIHTSDKGHVTKWDEKPEICTNINMGCYIMEPDIMKSIPKEKPYGMDDVIKNAISETKLVDSFLVTGGFLDIGSKSSYRKAYKEYAKRLGKI